MHYPVMLQNVLKLIGNMKLHRNISIIDCNFGLGGHSNAILQAFPNAYITAFDLDSTIIDKYLQAPTLQTGDQERLRIINDNFTAILKAEEKYDVILADLGFNSVQLEQHEGFSWNKNSSLDMRYSKNAETCSQFIKRLSFVQIVDLFVKYGDLNFTEAQLAAKKIEEAKTIKTTFQLRDCIVGCFHTNKTRKIAQVFQAFRIAINNQMQSLKMLCSGMDKILNKNSLIMMITFHSLERDAIYKQIKEKQKFYTKIKNETPSSKQIAENSRSKSAELLTFRKI